ncbi:MAG: hypothetical protein ACE5F1_20360, partial [Planctomycetota bacterium]
VPLMVAVFVTSDVVVHTIDADSQQSDVAEELRTTYQRLTAMLRPASLATVRTRATNVDVQEAQALAALDPLSNIPVPAPGDWIPMGELNSRSNLQFRTAAGELSMNAAALTGSRDLEFIRDSNEKDNNIDDDGDGLIDEGKLYLNYDTARVVLTDGVEMCTFVIAERVLKLTLLCARRDKSGRVHRVSIEHRVFLRNN